MKKIILIKAGGTFEELRREKGDFEDWTIRGMGVKPLQVRVVPVFAGESPPDPENAAGIVMTGSHSMVTDEEEWSEKLCPWIRRAVEKSIPFLGICYGHQLLARALGGEAGNHPQGPEIGTVLITLNAGAQNDPLFRGFPNPFPAHVTHTQSVLRLPPGARVLASSDYEPYHAVVFGQSAWGVQFHPEFDAEVMRYYIEAQAGKLRKLNRDPEWVREQVVETPESTSILVRFAQLAVGKAG
jgi:GMP synthase (glutamine-hydrolysing)